MWIPGVGGQRLTSTPMKRENPMTDLDVVATCIKCASFIAEREGLGPEATVAIANAMHIDKIHTVIAGGHRTEAMETALRILKVNKNVIAALCAAIKVGREIGKHIEGVDG